MPASRRDHAIGAIGASRAAKHTRKLIARERRDSHKPDPLAPQTPRCITDGLCAPSGHTGAVGCVRGPEGFPCWCGKAYNHDWPGRVDGAPHPR